MTRCGRHAESPARRSPRAARWRVRSIPTPRRAPRVPARDRSHGIASNSKTPFDFPGGCVLPQVHTFGREAVHTFGREIRLEGTAPCILWRENSACATQLSCCHPPLPWRRRPGGVGVGELRARSPHPCPSILCRSEQLASLQHFKPINRTGRVHTFGRNSRTLWGEKCTRRSRVQYISTFPDTRNPPNPYLEHRPVEPMQVCTRRSHTMKRESAPSAEFISVTEARLSITLRTGPAAPATHSIGRRPSTATRSAALTFRRGTAYRRARSRIPTGERVQTFGRDAAYYRERNTALTAA
jgi:hypothetical protein